ncbi:MAG TPA: hypothetical protein VF761_16960 [Gemmatimonadaceae bacterium]
MFKFRALLIALIALIAFPVVVQAQEDVQATRLTFVTGKKPAATYCRPGTLTLWFDGTAFRSGTKSDCTTWPDFRRAPIVVSIPIKLSKVANGDVLTNYTPGFAGKITKVAFAITDPVTTAAKATTLNLEIGTTDVTGGAIALTSANSTPLGAVIAGTAITAANTFTASSTISVEASSTTAFVEGEGVLLITIESSPAYP